MMLIVIEARAAPVSLRTRHVFGRCGGGAGVPSPPSLRLLRRHQYWHLSVSVCKTVYQWPCARPHGARPNTMEINQELLINLIKERPVLWDKTLDEYKNKRFTYEAWKDLCKILEPSFKEMDHKQQNEYGKTIMKKWTNMRDSWMKYCKKESKTDSTCKPKKYVFYEQMSFLKKLLETQPAVPAAAAEQATSNDSSTASNDSGCNPGPAKRKKLADFTDDAVDTNQMSLSDSREQESQSRAMYFFKSITPTVESFNDDEFVEFQYKMMETIKNIKTRARFDQPNNLHQRFTVPTRPDVQLRFPDGRDLRTPISITDSNDSINSTMDILDFNAQETFLNPTLQYNTNEENQSEIRLFEMLKSITPKFIDNL